MYFVVVCSKLSKITSSWSAILQESILTLLHSHMIVVIKAMLVRLEMLPPFRTDVQTGIITTKKLSEEMVQEH